MFRLFALFSLSLVPLIICDPLIDISSGLTYARCTDNDACRGDRECLDYTTQGGCAKENSGNCFCFPPEFTTCDQENDCNLGEFCGRGPSSPPICVSLALVAGSGLSIAGQRVEDFEPIDCSFVAGEETESGSRNGLNYERCEKQNDCKGSRQCLDAGLGDCCSSFSTACICMDDSLDYCENSDACGDDGEICLRSKVAPPRCVSSQARDDFNGGTLFEGSRAVCVDTKLLKGVEKVFDTDRVAKVLCDQWGQCATKGHMVTWGNGKVGMWKTYCEENGGCKETVKMVNSPKWKRGLRIEGKDVSFTAFAARWESKTEERLLRGVMRMGL